MKDKLTPVQENYLETIYIIQKEKKNVRVKDIVKKLNVKAPSVIEALNTLKKKGLIEQEPYGYIELTLTGIKTSQNLFERHKGLKKFFSIILGLDDYIAEEDACKVEHYLSQRTMDRVDLFSSYIESLEPGIIEGFKEHVKNKS